LATLKQIGNLLDKSFSKWEYIKAIKLSENESQTRDYLIEPFFNLLGYNKMEHYSHEFSLKFAKGSVKKVDMVISLNRRTPIMLIECKRSTSNLTDKNRQQLAEYFHNHKESKVGILTNGIVYEFYSVMWNDPKKLSSYPFMVFDLRDFTRADLEDLANFHIQVFNPQDILEISEEKYFLDDFNNALTQTLYPVGDELIKLVFQKMNGKRITEKISNKLSNLINSVSLQNSIEKIKVLEGEKSSTGIYTTAEELKAFQIIKTMLVMNPNIKNHDERIGFKDYKSQFKIVLDNMPSKEICNLILTNTTKRLVIDKVNYELLSISTLELSKYRKKLVDSALEIIS